MKKRVVVATVGLAFAGLVAGCGSDTIAVRPPVVQYVPPAQQAPTVQGDTVNVPQQAAPDVVIPDFPEIPAPAEIPPFPEIPAPVVNLPTNATNTPEFTNNPQNHVFTPLGQIYGVVVDAADNTLLEGVNVSLGGAAGVASASTDATGVFVLTGIPKSANASGTWWLTLDLSGVNNGRQYRPYQIQSLTNPTWETDEDGEGVPGAGTSGSDPNTNTWIDMTTASADVVRVPALRATVTGSVKSSVTGQGVPAESVSLVLKYCNNTVKTPSTGTVAGLATAAAPDFTFSFPTVEEGANFQIEFLDPNAWQFVSADLASGSTSYTGGCFATRTADTVGGGNVDTVLATIVVAPNNREDTDRPFIVTASPVDGSFVTDGNVGPGAPITFTFNEAMKNINPQKTAVKWVRERNRRGETAIDDYSRDIPFLASWTDTTTLSVEPLEDLVPGYVYEVSLDNGFLLDEFGNQRNGEIPNSIGGLNGKQPDAVEVLRLAGVKTIANNVADRLQFTVNADADVPVVSGLRPFPRTSDTAAGTVDAKNSQDAFSSTDTTPLATVWDMHERKGDFDIPNGAAKYDQTDAAYLIWDMPGTTSPQVSRYEIVAGLTFQDPNPFIVTHAGTAYSYSGLRTGAAVLLTDVLAALQNIYGGTYTFDTDWSAGLTVFLGIRAYNLDDEPGDIAWVTDPNTGDAGIRDNTSPRVADHADGLDWRWLADNNGCIADAATECNARIIEYTPGGTSTFLFPQLPGELDELTPTNGGLSITAYGQGVLKVKLTEPVLKSSIGAGTAVTITKSYSALPIVGAPADPNLSGTNDLDGAPTALDIAWLDNQNALPAGTTDTLFVKFSNIFGFDTGDVINIDLSGAKDAAGNALIASAKRSLQVVNRFEPWIKRVTLDAATNKVTIVFAQAVECSDVDKDATNGNCGTFLGNAANSDTAPAKDVLKKFVNPDSLPVDLSALLPGAGLTNNNDSLIKITKAELKTDKVTLEVTVNDLSFAMNDQTVMTRDDFAFNADIRSKAGSINDADRTSVESGQADDGTKGYAHFDNTGKRGAYGPADPTDSLGTKKKWPDTIGPRLVGYPSDNAELALTADGNHPNDDPDGLEGQSIDRFNHWYTVDGGVLAADTQSVSICSTEELKDFAGCAPAAECAKRVTLAWKRIGWCNGTSCTDANATEESPRVGQGSTASSGDGSGANDFNQSDTTTSPGTVTVNSITANGSCGGGSVKYDISVTTEDGNGKCGSNAAATVGECAYELDSITLGGANFTAKDLKDNTVDANKKTWQWHEGNPSADADANPVDRRSYWKIP